MRLVRLVAGGLIAGALAGFVAGLLRPRPRGVLPGLAPTDDPSIAGSAAPVADTAEVTSDTAGTAVEDPPVEAADAADASQPDASQPDESEWVMGDGGEFAVSAGRSRPQGEGAG